MSTGYAHPPPSRNATNEVSTARKLLELGQLRFEPGYWQGMRQPAVLISLRLTRREISWAAVRRFDEIKAVVCPSHDSDKKPPLIEAGVSAHPLLGRVLDLTLAVLARMGMPVMGGVKAVRLDPLNAWQWVVGLPAVTESNRAPQASFALACALMSDLASGAFVSSDSVVASIEKLLRQFQPLAPAGVNTLCFLQAAHELDIPWIHIANNVYQFGWGRRARWLDSSFTDETSTISASLARDKLACAKLLREAGLPVPRHQLVNSAEQAVKVADALGYPVVVKPANLDGGTGVLAGVRDAEGVKKGFDAVAKLSKQILVEQFIEGSDYRIRVCKGEVIGVVIRRAAAVTGDGVSTVRTLIQKTNLDRARRTSLLDSRIEQGSKPITVDDEVKQWLAVQGLNLDGVVAAGQRVRLRGAANVSLGGTTWEVTHEAHPDNLDLAVRAAAALRLDIAGVDLLLPDIARSWKETGGAICEVNGQPQFSSGSAHRKVIERLICKQGRIPVVGMSGLSCNPDLEQNVVQPLRQVGVSVALAASPEQCRQALRRADTDALIWQMNDPPSPGRGLPVDRLSLLIRPPASDLSDGRMSSLIADECWVLSESSSSEHLADRLIAYLREKGGSISSWEEHGEASVVKKPIVMILGFSGIGKSTFARFARDYKNWLWIELDQNSILPGQSDQELYPENGRIDGEYSKKLQAFLSSGRYRGAIISMRSTDVVDEKTAKNLESIGVKVFYFVARESFCLQQFESREAKQSQALHPSHWLRHNLKMSEFLKSLPESTKLNIVRVVDDFGNRISNEKIYENFLRGLEVPKEEN